MESFNGLSAVMSFITSTVYRLFAQFSGGDRYGASVGRIPNEAGARRQRDRRRRGLRVVLQLLLDSRAVLPVRQSVLPEVHRLGEQLEFPESRHQ